MLNVVLCVWFLSLSNIFKVISYICFSHCFIPLYCWVTPIPYGHRTLCLSIYQLISIWFVSLLLALMNGAAMNKRYKFLYMFSILGLNLGVVLLRYMVTL